MEKQKKFRCHWGKGYYGKEPINPHKKPWNETHTLDYFTTGKGYEPEHIAKINELTMYESLDLTDFLGQVHIIKRIQ